jgi:uncharacterized protein (TIGR02996 family)
MDEEAGFIAALLAEPSDVTTLLVYADWLDERADPRRAEYLRLLAAKRPNRRRLAQLRRAVDPVWALTVADRIGCDSTVRITAGSFQTLTGEVLALCLGDADEVLVSVRLVIWGRPFDVELPPRMLERVVAPAS